MLPLTSTNRTINTCLPSGNIGKINGLVQGTKSESSILHSKWSNPSTLVVENSNLIVLEAVLVSLFITLLLPSVVEFITVSGRSDTIGGGTSNVIYDVIILLNCVYSPCKG